LELGQPFKPSRDYAADPHRMKIHRLYRTQQLCIEPEAAWRYFWSPLNLQQMTPEFLHFRITSEVPPAIHPGLIISYRITAVAGIPMTWVTEIKDVIGPADTRDGVCQFVDEQRLGPFRFWHHLHRLTPSVDGVQIEDIVHYVMPWGWLGEVVHRVFIRRRLCRIFEFRRDYLDGLFRVGQR
jgi:ligand-binding SRPBCC domain-containing protein